MNTLRKPGILPGVPLVIMKEGSPEISPAGGNAFILFLINKARPLAD